MRSPLVPRHGGRFRRRLLALIAAPALGLSLLAATPSPAATTDGLFETAPPDVSVEDFESVAGVAEPVAVTLITGDTVHWVDAGDGNPSVANIKEAPRDVPVRFDQSGTQEDFYVIPSDVMAQVVDGSVDRELFNIPSLIRQGLDDKSTGGELPVIVTFDEAADEQELENDANALPAASEAQGVEGIQGAGVKINKKNAEKFREAVLTKPGNGNGRGPNTNAESDGLAGAVDKVLLDEMLQIDLSESVPQIGAPEAWEAGYTGEGVTVAVLDTGIDTNHPDLSGQVVVAENFVSEGEPADDHGHGTHVASTIAGTGAASDGARRGVAPDAELLSGKVCNAQGQCPTSAIMAGMEWATAQGADVVNMSLGDAPSDGTDPLSQLVNQLSAETGTLFVISAGNTQFSLRVVGSPAAADAALAVGAVDKSDRRASFSSRGPRVGDHAVKPEITGPGVGIVAARSSTGTDMGGGATPVDDHYVRANGTSMAAPHVAGAAALLAQANGLAGQDLKDALVSTAADGGHRWYEQGTGRVDVPAALDSPVYAQGTLNFGGVDGQAEKDLVYTNRSDHDVILSLEAAVSAIDGQPSGGVTLSADTLTVPAHGRASVTVTVTLEPSSVSSSESFGGVITATDPNEVEVRTGIGFGPPLHRVTIEVLDSNGDRVGTDTASDWAVSLIHDTVNPQAGSNPVYRFGTSQGIAVGHVPTGTYTFFTQAVEHEPGNRLRGTRVSVLVEVEVEIAADISIVLDARDAVPTEVSVPRKADKRNHLVSVVREVAGRDWLKFSLGAIGGRVPTYATPTPPGELAPLSLFVSWTLAEPQPLQPIPWDNSGLCPIERHRCFSETPAYVYNLPILYENGIPENLHERISRRDLVEVPTRFHSDNPGSLIEQTFGSFLPSTTVDWNAFRLSFRPGVVTEYFLADDRVTWVRRVIVERRPEGEQAEFIQLFSDDRFPAAEAGSRRADERWYEGPMRKGIWDVREESRHSPAMVERWANASRGGLDGNQFAVPAQLMDNSRGHSADLPSAGSWRMWNADTGAELEQTGWAFPNGTAVFPLAPKEASYRLEQVVDIPPSLGFVTGQDHTTWMFTSRPSDAPVPQRYGCSIRDHRSSPQEPWSFVCQIQPLILLEYDLGLDINNRAPAGRLHRFTVTAGHHSKAIDRSKVTDLSVEASFDRGETWTDARVVGRAKDSWDTGGFLPSAGPRQEFKVVLDIPPLHRTDGFVALRVKAEDANGGTIEQTIKRAYLLKPPDEGVAAGRGS